MASPAPVYDPKPSWWAAWWQPGIIIMLAVALVGFYTSIQLHHADSSIHTPISTLDQRYVRQDVKAEEDKRWEQAFADLNAHLDKIEAKLEKK